MELGHFRESIILRGAKRIDPDEELEKRMSDVSRGGGATGGGGRGGAKEKDKKKEKGKGKGKGKKEGKGESRGAEAASGLGPHNDVSSSEGAGLSTYNDIPSGNGERARPKEEDHYGFLYSISEADRH